MMLHSPRNFGGTRTRPANKLICMLGMGPQAVCVLVDLNSALANCDIIVPTANELLACTTVQEVEAIAPPARALRNANDFEGSAVFIPGPLFRNTIIASGTTNPLQLIPLITATARAFEVRVNDEEESSATETQSATQATFTLGSSESAKEPSAKRGTQFSPTTSK